ncbi:MAG: diheme cytochrome c [Proteobacteria bacterium]|nr:diheme cytochrome c [Pseudomonadota bacterium]
MKLYVLILTALISVFFSTTLAMADDHERKHRTRERHHSEDHLDDAVPEVANQLYAETCGACHFAYPPGLLNANSWSALLRQVEDHFGESLALDASQSTELMDYLTANAAERSQGELAADISDALGSRTVLRITEVSEIRKEHRKISQDVFARPSVGGFSNCVACHQRAEKGVFDDDEVSIPH